MKARLQSNEDHIFGAAKRFDADPYLLGAIIIDEIVRANPIEEITDVLGLYFIGKNTSAGVAQVKVETARALIQDGYYNPEPNDIQLSPENIHKTRRSYLYDIVKKPAHSIHFAAARIRDLIDKWKRFVDLTKRPEIIATLYSMGKSPHSDPKPNERGFQIANEFYRLTKQWLH